MINRIIDTEGSSTLCISCLEEALKIHHDHSFKLCNNNLGLLFVTEIQPAGRCYTINSLKLDNLSLPLLMDLELAAHFLHPLRRPPSYKCPHLQIRVFLYSWPDFSVLSQDYEPSLVGASP